MHIDFATSARILFGPGKIEQLPELVGGLGRRAFFTRSASLLITGKISSALQSKKIDVVEFIVRGEPDIESVLRAASLARESECDFVISAGGGSVIDTGKAIAAILANPGELMDYLEVVGRGMKLANKAKPHIAIPTTAGTGSEVTRNAVIAVPEKQVKVSLRSPLMLPDIALVDPDLTISMPPALTAATGMDAFIQVIEPYVSKSANPMVDMFCRDAIPRAAQYLPQAFQNGQDKTARGQMAWVSLMGGLSLANAGLGASHGFAGPLGGMFAAPHGALCAAVISGVMRVNVAALKDRAVENPALRRYEEIAAWLTGKPQAAAEEGADWMGALCASLKIPGLSELGIQRDDFAQIIEKSENSSSMKGNPIQLTREEMTQILEMSF
ncbi:MAG: iron-containing alcohol dehydrogenase [Chloroflexota bacterium]